VRDEAQFQFFSGKFCVKDSRGRPWLQREEKSGIGYEAAEVAQGFDDQASAQSD
jgi:hypothetical protein